MADSDRNLIVVKSPGGPKPSRPPSLSYDRSRRLYVSFVVSLYLLYMLLIQLTRLRFKKEKEGPFETHSVLMRTTVSAFLVAGITSGVLYNEYLPSYSKSLSPVVFKIAKIVFFFSAILAFITLLLVLIID